MVSNKYEYMISQADYQLYMYVQRTYISFCLWTTLLID